MKSHLNIAIAAISMKTFNCYDAFDRLIGFVDALDGDVAWLLAVVADARTFYILPSWVALASKCH
jgi:hypothetical protein